MLRVTRILRLAGKAEGLQAILQTIMFSIPSLSNVFVLLMIIFFMFAIIGNELFKNVTTGEVISASKNFRTFEKAILLVLAVSTGEDWNVIMYDCSKTPADGCIVGRTCGSEYSFVYFNVLILVCTYVMLNLFILVIIGQFEKYYLPKDNAIVLFKSDLACFMDVWKKKTRDRYRCRKLKESQLLDFFKALAAAHGDSFRLFGGRPEQSDEKELQKEVLKMGIKGNNGFIYFNELLYRCMRRKYGNMKLSKQMQIFELKTQYRIYLLTLEMRKAEGGKTASPDDLYKSII